MFVEYITDILSSIKEVKTRKMFGGYGIYCNNVMFAVIIDNELYFKADNTLAEEYKKFDSFPFTYQRDNKTIALSYWYVPSEVIEDTELLETWFNKSLELAQNKKRKNVKS